MDTIREQAQWAWRREQKQSEELALAQGEKLKRDLVELGLKEELLTVGPGCVEADRESMTFRRAEYGFAVRDHDWGPNLWEPFFDLPSLGEILANHASDEDEMPVPADWRTAQALERIAELLGQVVGQRAARIEVYG